MCVLQVWTALLRQAPQQYVVAASCPWMGAWLCLMMQAAPIPIDLNMLLEVKARSKVNTRTSTSDQSNGRSLVLFLKDSNRIYVRY